jgi:hypothetical protein
MFQNVFNNLNDGEHMFMLMFFFLEFKKLIIDNKRFNIWETVFFVRFKNFLMIIKSIIFNKKLQ